MPSHNGTSRVSSCRRSRYFIQVAKLIICRVTVSILDIDPYTFRGAQFYSLYAAHACVLSCVPLFEIPWTVAHPAPLSLEFSKQEYQSGLPFPSPGDLPEPGIEPKSLTSPPLTGGFFSTLPLGSWVFYNSRFGNSAERCSHALEEVKQVPRGLSKVSSCPQDQIRADQLLSLERDAGVC